MGKHIDKFVEKTVDSHADKIVGLMWKIVPFAAVAVTWLMSHILGYIFSSNPLMWAALICISTTALVAERAMVGMGGRLRRLLQAAMSGFLGYWTAVAIVLGSTGTVGLVLLWGGFFFLAPAVAILSEHVDNVDSDESRTDRFMRRFDKVKEVWGHGKTKLTKLPPVKRSDGTENPYKTQYEIEVDDITQNSDTALELRNRIAAKEHISKDQVVISPDPKDYHKARATIVTGDIETSRLTWEGPSIPEGGTMNDPIRLGLRIDGEPGHMSVPDRHIQVMGMTGSGKSFGFAWNFVSEIITRYSDSGRVDLWGIDIVKGRQTFGPMEQAFDRTAVTEEQLNEMLIELKQEIRNRMNALTEEGFNTWNVKSKLRYRIIIMEEAPAVFQYMEEEMGLYGSEQAKFWKEARSAGITLVTSLQIATHGEQPKSVLRQIANRICFGVSEFGDADYGLNAQAVKNGADPSKWSSFNPGMCYMSVEGIPPNEWHTPVRTYLMTREDMVRHCAKYPAPGKEDWVLSYDENGMLVAVPPEEGSNIEEDGISYGVTYVNKNPVADTIEGTGTEKEIKMVFSDPQDQEEALRDEAQFDKELQDRPEGAEIPVVMSSISFGAMEQISEATARERILKLLEEYHARGVKIIKPSAIVGELELSRQNVSNVLSLLVRDKILTKEEYARYSFGPNWGKVAV